MTETVQVTFLPCPSVPFNCAAGEWQPLMDALPDFIKTASVPKPIEIDVAARQVRLFLPGFDKQVNLPSPALKSLWKLATSDVISYPRFEWQNR